MTLSSNVRCIHMILHHTILHEKLEIVWLSELKTVERSSREFMKTPWTQIRQRQETTASNWKRTQGDLISQERSYHWPWQPVDILISHRPGPKREVRGWLKVATYRLQSRKDSFLLDPRFRENNDFFSLLHYRFLSDETGARVEWYSIGKNVEIIEPHFAVTQVHFSKSWLFYIFLKSLNADNTRASQSFAN